jgi:hypothetical protein
VAQEGHLAQGAARVDQVLKRVGDLLDGHLLPGLVVLGGADHAVGAFAHRLDGDVLVVHQEVGAPELVACLARHQALLLHWQVCCGHGGALCDFT